jgi:CheY-like chemotaxis protein
MEIKKILLVDDDKDDQFFFIEALKELNDTIVCKTEDNGVKGLAALQLPDHPDMIFLDLNMPQMNGFDLLSKIKKDEVLAKIPVVIFSTSNHQHDIDKAKELGSVAFLTKPNDMNTLSEKLAKAISIDPDKCGSGIIVL